MRCGGVRRSVQCADVMFCESAFKGSFTLPRLFPGLAFAFPKIIVTVCLTWDKSLFVKVISAALCVSLHSLR
jgi:hypothetical protein